MNERTEALAKQAAEYAIEFATQDQELYIPKLMEKFAELIIRECCDWIEGSPTSESGCQLLLTKSFIIANLKGHFGV